MSDPNLIRDLACAGLEPDLLQRVAIELARGQAAIAAAAKAEADEKARQEAIAAAKRAANAERQRRFRDKNNAGNALCAVTQRDEALPPQSSPTPPKTTPQEISPSDPIGSSAPQGARQPRKPRNRPLPDDWQPGPMSDAARLKLERSTGWMLDTAEEMRSWAKGGGHVRTDWDEVHCNWMRREAKRETQLPQARNGPPSRPASAQERAMQFAKQANLELMGDPDDPGPFADDATARPADGGYQNGHAHPGFYEPAGRGLGLAPPRLAGPPRPH